MADILKVTTPLIEKAPVTSARPVADPSMPFNLSDVTRVVQPSDTSELLQQNTGFMDGDENPKILADLMKDPAVTVTMMRNISLLQEVIKLIPAGNTALTHEVEQLFNALMLNPDQIVAELLRQEQSTTVFKGDLFDQLRNLLAHSQGDPDILTGVGVLLKSLNAAMSRSDSLDSVANNLRFLLEGLVKGDPEAGSLAARLLQSRTVLDGFGRQINHLSQVLQGQAKEGEAIDLRSILMGDAEPGGKTAEDLLAFQMTSQNLQNVMQGARLSEKLDVLIQLLRSPDAASNYSALKNATLSVLKEVEGSVLFSADMEKTLPLAIYNLSRFNDNPDFLPDAVKLLFSQIAEGPGKERLLDDLQAFVDRYVTGKGGAENDSEVMRALSDIIGKQAGDEELRLLSGDKMERIVQSLLSSPSNFTPLLHFIVPVEFMDTRAFAEIWIDPNAGEGEEGGRGGEMGTHMLMVFDVEEVGRFEAELFVQEKRIAMNLLCPEEYLSDFQGIGGDIRRAIAGTGYKFEAINIDRLERTHSLMDVFTDLPHKRTGIDVKI